MAQVARPIYNKERKMGFVESLESEVAKKNALIIFRKISDFEYKVNSDISECDKEMCFNILNEISFKSNNRKNYLLLILSNYVDYEISKNKTSVSCNYVKMYKENKKSSIIETYKSEYFKDPSSLYSELFTLFGNPTPNSRYVSYFAFFCLVYCGFNENEILQLQRSDVNFDLGLICKKVIYPELWQPIINSLNTTLKYGRGDKEYSIINDYIIKNDVKDFSRYMKIKMNKLKKENAIKINVTVQNVQKSGGWYAIYIKEKQGLWVMLSSEGMSDYINYKKAFWS